MKTTYTQQELVDRWRLERHLEPLRADVVMEFDGVDTSELDVADAMAWWLHTVDTAPLDWLNLSDCKADAKLELNDEAGCVELVMAPGRPLRRVGSLRLEGWLSNAAIVESDDRVALMQLNGASRAGTLRPVAVRLDPWHWRLYPPVSTRLESLTAVDENDYTFDDRCWGRKENENL